MYSLAQSSQNTTRAFIMLSASSALPWSLRKTLQQAILYLGHQKIHPHLLWKT